jgi:hypothetical protein
MSRPTRIEVNCTTNETHVVELTDEEIAQIEADAIIYQEKKAKEIAEAETLANVKKSALEKLANLGLTAEEAKTIIG